MSALAEVMPDEGNVSEKVVCLDRDHLSQRSRDP